MLTFIVIGFHLQWPNIYSIWVVTYFCLSKAKSKIVIEMLTHSTDEKIKVPL